jgi:hypothetical protein
LGGKAKKTGKSDCERNNENKRDLLEALSHRIRPRSILVFIAVHTYLALLLIDGEDPMVEGVIWYLIAQREAPITLYAMLDDDTN